MAEFTQGHTPFFTIHEKNGVNFSQFAHVYVTITQGLFSITKKDEQLQIDNDTITFTLSQGLSLGFGEGEAELQVNVTDQNGLRYGNKEPVTFTINRNLLRKAVE